MKNCYLGIESLARLLKKQKENTKVLGRKQLHEAAELGFRKQGKELGNFKTQEI